MKTIKNLTFAALAATLLFQTAIARADDDHGRRGDDNERGDRDRDHRDRRDAKATFTKWGTAFPNEPGRIFDMAGVVGGDVGRGTFSGEVLHYIPITASDPVEKLVAFYRFHGSKHSFTALVRVEQTGAGPGTKAVIIGVVTDGWRKGHAVKGKYTEGICGTPSHPCFSGYLEIEGDSND